jgi:LacI family transcriptional regulator
VPIRLRDVATMAGVSPATVSRFVNGHLRLPQATGARILQAVAATGYQPNPHARRLSTGRSDSIGLVVPDIANPFFARLAAAVEAEADERKLEVSLFVTLNRPGREREYVQALVRNRVDGLIFATNHADHAEFGQVGDLGDKVVLVDEDVPDLVAPRVFCDNREGGRLAGQYLRELGHARVGYVGAGPEMISGRRRLEGLRQGLGPDAEVSTAFCSYSREGGVEAAVALLEGGPRVTAIFAAADELAIGVLEVLHARGLRVPEDVSLVGFDDVAPLALFAPAITALRQPIEDMGRRAVDLLVAPDDGPRRQGETILPVTLIRRASCGPARSTNRGV